MAQFSDDYARKMDAFLTQNGLDEQADPVDVYHAVRRVPYGSRGGRSPVEVLSQNLGSCSGKHVLLRDLLRHVKQNAVVETVKGDFAAGVPVLGSMSLDLQQYCRTGGVTDFHHYVVWSSPNGEKKLDATWSDRPISGGVPGNAAWRGEGDTKLALTPEETLDRREDVATYKESLIVSLEEDEQVYRAKFLTLLSDWAAALEWEGEAR